MERIVMVKNFPNRAFAEQAKDLLERNNIPCVLKSPDIGILGTASSGAVQGVDLYVSEALAEKAYEYLNALFNGI